MPSVADVAGKFLQGVTSVAQPVVMEDLRAEITAKRDERLNEYQKARDKTMMEHESAEGVQDREARSAEAALDRDLTASEGEKDRENDRTVAGIRARGQIASSRGGQLPTEAKMAEWMVARGLVDSIDEAHNQIRQDKRFSSVLGVVDRRMAEQMEDGIWPGSPEYRSVDQLIEELSGEMFGGEGEGGEGGKDIYTEQNPARPTTDDEYNQLPSGAVYVDPDDGKLYRKP